MFKIILRFLIVTAVAIALGLLIYHLNQPAASASFGAGSFGGGGFEGGREFGERGFSLARGLSGVVGNLFLVAVVTVIVSLLRKAFGYRPVLVRRVR